MWLVGGESHAVACFLLSVLWCCGAVAVVVVGGGGREVANFALRDRSHTSFAVVMRCVVPPKQNNKREP